MAFFSSSTPTTTDFRTIVPRQLRTTNKTGNKEAHTAISAFQLMWMDSEQYILGTRAGE